MVDYKLNTTGFVLMHDYELITTRSLFPNTTLSHLDIARLSLPRDRARLLSLLCSRLAFRVAPTAGPAPACRMSS